MAMSVAGRPGGRKGRGGRGRRAPISEINVTPFVDVMLVLLIIFMVTAPLLTAGVPVELPESRAKALAEEARQVTISVARDGTLYIDESPVMPGDLPARLAALPRDAADKPPLVTLRADKALEYGLVMGVMGELNRAGITSISLVTSASVAPPSLRAGSGSGE